MGNLTRIGFEHIGGNPNEIRIFFMIDEDEKESIEVYRDEPITSVIYTLLEFIKALIKYK
jgi:hypothetical protein